MHHRLTTLLACLTIGWTVALFAADTPEQMFSAIYGEQVRQAERTRNGADDAVLAGELLMAAAQVDESPAFQELLYRKAYALALRDGSGAKTAQQAADGLRYAEAIEDVEYRTMRLEVFETQYGTAMRKERAAAAAPIIDEATRLAALHLADEAYGKSITALRRAMAVASPRRSEQRDELVQLLRHVRALQQAAGHAAALERQLDGSPDDTSARRELAELYLFELNRPDVAALHTGKLPDVSFASLAVAAGQNVDELTEAQLLALMDAYVERADGAGEIGRLCALRRAMMYGRRFLAVHSAEDAQRLKVKVNVQRMDEQFAEVTPLTVLIVFMPHGDEPVTSAIAVEPVAGVGEPDAMLVESLGRVRHQPFAAVRVDSTWQPFKVVPKAKVGEKQESGWHDLPPQLRQYSHSAIKSHTGHLDFAVTSPGIVILATGQKDWGDRGLSGGDWRKEVQSRDDLRAMGWVEMGSLNSGEWLVLSRKCRGAEEFHIRTKKYLTPILIRPMDHDAGPTAVTPEVSENSKPENAVPDELSTPVGKVSLERVCQRLQAKRAPKDLRRGVIHFTAPHGNGRRGANGALVRAAPLGDRGSVWSMRFQRGGSARGIQIVHPFKRGHVMVTVHQRGAHIVAGGHWADSGYTRLGPRAVDVVRSPDFERVFPLAEHTPHQLTSVMRPDGVYQLYVARRLVAAARVDAAEPLRLSEGFVSADKPVQLSPGDTAVIVGPTDNGDIFIEDVYCGPLK